MKLFEIVDGWAHADEVVRWNDGKGKVIDEKPPAKKEEPETRKKPEQPRKRNKKLKAEGEVLGTKTEPQQPRHFEAQGEASGWKWCLIHKTGSHSLVACSIFQKEMVK